MALTLWPPRGAPAGPTSDLGGPHDATAGHHRTSDTYLVLRATAIHDEPGTAGAWQAEVADPASPLAGLYGFGDSLTAARDALAVVAWTAVLAGELGSFGFTANTLAGLHVVVSTCATYDAAWLAAAVDAA